jgi:hypothetical protein
MARRKGDAELRVRTSFEAARTATQCLSAAYERLVPAPPVHPTRGTVRAESSLNSVAEAVPLPRRRVEGG